MFAAKLLTLAWLLYINLILFVNSTRARLMYGLQSEPVKETLGATGSQQVHVYIT